MKLGSINRQILVLDEESGELLNTIPISSLSNRCLERLNGLFESELQERDGEAWQETQA